MNYNDFLNLPEIKKRNAEPGDAGILIHEGDKISENINLGKTRNEIKFPHNIVVLKIFYFFLIVFYLFYTY